MPSGGGLMPLLRRERVSEPKAGAMVAALDRVQGARSPAVLARGLGALAADPGPGALSSGARSNEGHVCAALT
jgi:hypothetical protein